MTFFSLTQTPFVTFNASTYTLLINVANTVKVKWLIFAVLSLARPKISSNDYLLWRTELKTVKIRTARTALDFNAAVAAL